MNRIVYLFEMDSVCNYGKAKEKGVTMTPGVQALFCEIIKNGNVVALSMNQLTDSQFIKEALTDDVAYESMLSLFEAGSLRVNLYGPIRTASQYIQNAVAKSLDKKAAFCFSNLPVKQEERVLLEEIRDALQYSDLTRLQAEVEEATDEEKARMTMIYRFVKMVLQLSVSETSNIPAYVYPEGENRTLDVYIAKACAVLEAECEKDDAVREAVELLKERKAQLTDDAVKDNRSNWMFLEERIEAQALANRIIDLCYNYRVENSVSGVSKHYEEGENFDASFQADFLHRFAALREGKTAQKPAKAVSRGQWKKLVRFSNYGAKKRKNIAFDGQSVYERGFEKERRKWAGYIFGKNLLAIGLAFVYILVFFLTELLFSVLEGNFEISSNAFVSSMASILLFGIFGALIGLVVKMINHGADMPDLLQSIKNIGIHAYDALTMFGGEYDSYKLP